MAARRLMWDLSRLVTLAPMHALLRSEIAATIARRGLPVSTEVQAAVAAGFGVYHAFAGPTGRLVLSETVGRDGDNGPRVRLDDLPEEQRALYEGGGVGYEWFSLAGLPRDMRSEPMSFSMPVTQPAAQRHWAAPTDAGEGIMMPSCVTL